MLGLAIQRRLEERYELWGFANQQVVAANEAEQN